MFAEDDCWPNCCVILKICTFFWAVRPNNCRLTNERDGFLFRRKKKETASGAEKQRENWLKNE